MLAVKGSTSGSVAAGTAATTKRTRRSRLSYGRNLNGWHNNPDAWHTYSRVLVSPSSTNADSTVVTTVASRSHCVACAARLQLPTSAAAGRGNRRVLCKAIRGGGQESTEESTGRTAVFVPPKPRFSEHDAWKSLEFKLESIGEAMMDAARQEDYHLAAAKKAELEELVSKLDISDYALYELTRPLKLKPPSFVLPTPNARANAADKDIYIGRNSMSPNSYALDFSPQSEPYHDQIERIAAEIKAAQQLGALGDSRALHTLAEALRRGHDPSQSVDPHSTEEQASDIAMKIRDDTIVEVMWTLFEQPPKEVAELYWSGRHFLQIQNLQRAHTIFNDVIAKAPWFAEGLNKRATVLYLLRQYEASIEDCERVVSILPMHFGALSGAGLCCVALGDYKGALEWLSRARQVYPGMPSVVSQMEAIKLKLLEDS